MKVTEITEEINIGTKGTALQAKIKKIREIV